MMNYWKLLSRSLDFYRKSHFWVVLGTMISTAILVGALVIGDSVKFSLQQIVFDRLGNTELALNSGNRFFRAQIADDLSKILDTTVAPLLQTNGIAIVEGGQRRLNNVQIIGVDDRFGKIAGIKDFYNHISPDEAIINHHLALRLQLKKGDEFLLRIKKLDMIPKDIPLSLDTDLTMARPFKIKAIASDTQFGRFNLKANQVAPNTVFVSLPALSKEMGYDNRANVLLTAAHNEAPAPGNDEAFKRVWTIADIGLEVKEFPGRDMIEIKSSRIFLDPPIVDAALKINKKAQPVLTYFVNEIRLEDKSTPYSFISAPGSSIVPPGIKDDEIMINEWLARDLGANQGDRIQLTYYVLGPM